MILKSESGKKYAIDENLLWVRQCTVDEYGTLTLVLESRNKGLTNKNIRLSPEAWEELGKKISNGETVNYEQITK